VTLEPGDLDPDPVAQFTRWLDDVVAAGLPEPMAMVLATAPAGDGAQPLARHVLLRGVDQDGFRFVTNRRSRKGRHLAENPRAALVFPWYPIHRQVIVTGEVGEASEGESDAYFASRPRESQVAAWASDQSEPVPSRAWLDERYDAVAAEFEGRDVARPPHWGMYVLAPESIELWQQGPHRMHDRFLYERTGRNAPWTVTRLAP
jgi:pyridoxamine 5'-phosphate oxidase